MKSRIVFFFKDKTHTGLFGKRKGTRERGEKKCKWEGKCYILYACIKSNNEIHLFIKLI